MPYSCLIRLQGRGRLVNGDKVARSGKRMAATVPAQGILRPDQRRFLMLQGPHGPFFHRLAKGLRAAGAQVWRVGFNAGDRAFWFGADGYLPYRGRAEDWPQAISALLAEHGITDLVLYGDTRPIHAQAIAAARAGGVTIHVFEEGYMRPYWVTYERGGSNGHSRLMDLSVADMRRALEHSDIDVPQPPARWGDMRHHVFYGALYHWFVLFRNGDYRNFRRHRELSVARESWLYTRRLLLMPLIALDRWLATQAVRFGGWPYHLVLMQLEHDASFLMHGPFTRMEEFLTVVIDGFAKGAPQHHHLVFKAHPLENGRSPLRRMIRRLAADRGIAQRVHYVAGGKLARLLDHARTAVTVNSTAAQQVLWRGIPLKVFGRAVYAKPEFVSAAPLPDFFAEPGRPDTRAYKDYRRFLLETSQVPGGFYSTRGRRHLMRQVVDMMLAPEDPYDALRSGRAAPRQPLRIVT
jgi:capsular polysaccharide export protein